MANLLLEIGTEELPLASLDVIYGELAEKCRESLKAGRIGFREVRVEATPRRIVLFIEGLAPRQEDQVLELRGPSEEKAFDEQKKPTRALEGFLKSREAEVSDIEWMDTPKGRFVMLRRREKGQALSRVLPELLQGLIGSLSFPKNMRWDPTGFRFPRPIRWILALLDESVVRMQLANVKSGRKTFGHRFLAPRALTVRRADWKAFTAALKKAHVVLSLKEREERVRSELASRFAQKHPDEELVHLSAQLVEEPFLLEGGFDRDYLRLPPEVLASCMKKNQKIFACYGVRGKMENRFVAVLNGRRAGLARIRSDYENVLQSRLHDARFFYEADTKARLETKVPLLDQIVYLGGLGTVYRKAERMKTMAAEFATSTGQSGLGEDLARAAWLCKADLMTQMVYEFPDLQGIVGREYALVDGEKQEIAAAIGMQYLPKNLSEDFSCVQKQFIPLAALLGILDRLDLLTGAFAIGLEPTGSQDPFALRRAGGTVIKLVRSFRFPFSMRAAMASLYSLFEPLRAENPEKWKSEDETCAALTRFLRDRVVFELQLKSGTKDFEIFEAVWSADADCIADVFDRIEVLGGLLRRSPQTLTRAGKVVERTGNIVKGMKDATAVVRPELFQDPLENRIFQLFQDRGSEVSSSVLNRDYEKATRLFGEIFYLPLHDFFEQVMVNVEDPAIRSNRQALMKSINRLYTDKLADLSVLSRIE